MTTLADFTKGQRVRYIGHHPKHQVHGLTGRVVATVKSRNVVTVEFDQDQGWCALYDARPENLESVQ